MVIYPLGGKKLCLNIFGGRKFHQRPEKCVSGNPALGLHAMQQPMVPRNFLAQTQACMRRLNTGRTSLTPITVTI